MEKSSKVIHVSAPPKGTLGRSDLYSIGVGQAVGSGVLTLIGPAILLTGQSAWLAYVVACVVGFFMIAPLPWICSTLRISGGFYSVVAGLAGEKAAGMYAVGFLPQTINLATYAVAIGMYANSIFPILNAKWFGIMALSLFLVINLFGVNVMAKVQKILVVVLLACLAMFIVIGCMNISNPVFDIGRPDFFSGGGGGFFSAIMLYVYSTNGYSCIMNYGKQSKNAQKDVPRALLYCVPTLAVVYGGVALVASGVLPLDQVAGQPLTYVAQTVLNNALFVVFMIGGPLMALSSSINSTISNNCIPVAQSCDDGWLPKSWAARNRYGVAWKLMIFTYLMGCLPVLFDFTISQVVNNIMLLASVIAFIQIYAYFQFPKKYKDAWEKSSMHISNTLFYGLCLLSLITYICIFVNSCRSLNIKVVLISLIAIAVCMVYGFFRAKSPEVKIYTSMWTIDDEEKENE